MTTFLDTGFENGACVGGLGFDQYGTTPNTAITLDAGTAKNGTYALRCAGRIAYVVKNIYSEVTTIRFYFKPNALPHVSATSIIEIFDNISQNSMQISLLSTAFPSTQGKLRPTIAGVNGSNSTTVLTAGTGYWIDARFDSSGTTWKIDYKISDASGSLLEAPSQFTQTGLVELRQHFLYLGPVAGSSGDTPDYSYDDVKATDVSGDYPLGAGDSSTGDNTPAALVLPRTQTWVDDPSLVKGGMLFGENAFIGNGPNWPMVLCSETSAKANRKNYITHVSYTGDVLAPPHMNLEQALMNGSLLGHECWPIVDVFGFGGSTDNWPAGGLADFTSGAMDTTLDAWVALWNTLPATPLLVRLWHEMNLSGTIYGANGAAHGGLNETTTTFIAAWRYVVTYLRARCPWLRFVWCPGGATVTGYAQWYPGDAYVDWTGTDIYTAGGLTPTANFANWYAAFNPSSGTVSKKPAIVCETGVDAKTASLSGRITCVQDYANFATHFPGIPAMVFWDAATNNDPASSYYPIQDIPSGWLAAYQSVVSATPFTGVPKIGTTTNPGLTTNVLPSISVNSTGAFATETGRVDCSCFDPVNNRWYIGGNFSGSNSVMKKDGSTLATRNYLMAIDGTSLDLISWNPNPNGRVYDIRVSPDGTLVYVSGAFTTIGGGTRHSIAAINASDGTVNSLIGDLSLNSTGRGIQLSKDGLSLFVGGNFTNGGGGTRALKLNLSTSPATVVASWAPSFNAVVRHCWLDEVSSRLICVGDFTDAAHKYVASIDTGNGTTKSFAYQPSDRVIDVDGIPGVSVHLGEVADRNTRCLMPAGTMDVWQGCDGNVQANLCYQDKSLSGHHGGCVAKTTDLTQANLSNGVCPNGGTISQKCWMSDEKTMVVDKSWLPHSTNTPQVLGVWSFSTDGARVMMGGDFTAVQGQPNTSKVVIFDGNPVAAPASLPVYGANVGDWNLVSPAIGGVAGWRAYDTPRSGIPSPPSGTNYHISSGQAPSSGVTLHVISLKPDVLPLIAGTYDTALAAYAAAMPAGDWLTLWHEGDSSDIDGAGTPLTTTNVPQLHAHAYTVVKGANPNILYGQILTAYTANPSSANYPLGPWVATQSGGDPLDFYSLDGYKGQPGYTVASVFGAAATAILAVVPTANLAITETNATNASDRPLWFAQAWAWAKANNCLCFFPFYDTSTHPWLPSDTATITELSNENAESKGGTVTPQVCPPGTTGIWPNCVPIITHTPPTVNITSPGDGTSIQGNSTTVQADVSVTESGATIVSVTMSVNGGAAVNMTGGNPNPDTTPPSVPTNLALQSFNSAGMPNLTWRASTDNVAVTGYNIYRDGTQHASTPLTTFIEDANLTLPQTTYSYTVTAVDAAANESAQSTPLSVTTPPTPGGGGAPVWFTGNLATGTASASATPPSGTQSGDLMLAQVTTVGAAVSSAPSGWSLIAPAQTDSTRISHAVYKKTAGSSETSAYTWAASGAATTDVQITTTRNATLGGVISTGSSGSSDNSHTLPALSGFGANDVALAFVADDSSPIFHPRTGCTLGCMPDGSLSNWSDNTALASFETLIGRKVHYSHSMVPWDVQSGSSCTIPTRALDHGNTNIIGDYNLNRISYFSWPRPRHTSSGDGSSADWTTVFGSNVDPNSVFDAIVAGTHDAVITRLANGIKNWEHLVVLRLFWEPNDGMPWSIKTSSNPSSYPAKYVAACRYIIAKILAVTTNVWFHFNPQLFENKPAQPASTMYWGDDVVTYAGQEWYLNPATGTQPANTGETFHHYEDPIYNLYVARTNAQGQPMVFGAGEGNAELPSGTVSGGQAFCYASVGTALIPQGQNPSTLPQFKFLTQWDNSGVTDSRLSVSPASALAAYKALVNNSYMQPALTDTWLPVSGWHEEYQTRHPLGNATARTNYGAGQQGHGLWSKTPGVGSSPTVTFKGGGLGRWGGIVIQLIAGGGGGGGGDVTGPTLTTNPSSDTTYPSGTTSVTLTGTASDPSGVASVKVNGTTVTVAADGSFSKTIPLVPGANTVTVVATDASPNQNQTTRTLILTVSNPVATGTKVAFIADWGGPPNITVSRAVWNQIPTDSSLAWVVNGGDNYNRGTNDAQFPTDMTQNVALITGRGLLQRTIATLGNHEGPNRDIVPSATHPTFQGYRYVWGNAGGLAAGNAGHADGSPIIKTINGWTLIIVDTVAVSPTRTLDATSPDSECGVGSAQLAQIQAALPATRKAVVFGHHPRWNADSQDHTDGTNGTANNLAGMQPLWTALQGHAVAYLSGHAHNMQLHQPRDATGAVTAPDAQGRVAGVTQIVAGSGGGLNYSLNNSYTPAPVWTDGGGVPGYVLLDFSSTSQVGVQFIGQTGTVLKAVNLV